MVLAETCPTQWVLERCGLLIVSYAYKILELVKESGQSERQEDKHFQECNISLLPSALV